MTNNHKLLLKKISPRLALGYILYDFFSPIGWMANILAFLSLAASFYFIWKGLRNTKSVTLSRPINVNSVMLVLFALIIFFGSPNERSILGKNFKQIKKAQVFFSLISEFKDEIHPVESIERNSCFLDSTIEGIKFFQYCNISFASHELTVVKDLSLNQEIELFKNMIVLNRMSFKGFDGAFKETTLFISGFENLDKLKCMKSLKAIHELYATDKFKMKDIILNSKDKSFCKFKILETGKYSALVGAIEVKK